MRRAGRWKIVSLCGLAALCMLVLGAIATPQTYATGAHHSNADDASGITFTPSSGTVGTVVTVTLVSMADSVGAGYALYATMTDPSVSMEGCGIPIPGVEPFTVHQGSNVITFPWPAALDHGPYWICAQYVPPASGGSSGSVAYNSDTAFTVIGAVPTPLPTSGMVIANVPQAGILPGKTFTLTVTNWHSTVSQPPQTLFLTQTDPRLVTPGQPFPGVQTPVKFTMTPGPATGDYVLTVAVPPTLDPGTYWAVLSDKSGALVYSKRSFLVASPPIPTVIPAHRAPSSASAGATDGPPSLLVVGILLALALAMGCAFFVRRELRSRRRQQQARDRAAYEQHLREQQQRAAHVGNQWPGDPRQPGGWPGAGQPWGEQRYPQQQRPPQAPPSYGGERTWPRPGPQWPQEPHGQPDHGGSHDPRERPRSQPYHDDQGYPRR